MSLFLAPRTASSCTKFCDEPPVRLFPDSAEIPGNFIYFEVLLPDPGRLELVTAAGKRVAATVRQVGGDRVFAPLAPVPAGEQLVLRYQQRCLGKLSDRVLAFRTAPPANPKPRAAGLQIIEQGTRFPRDLRNESRFYRVRYYSPDESPDTTHLLAATATIDGRVLPFAATSLEPYLMFVEASCAAERATEWSHDSCGELRQVPQGEHTIAVSARILGSSERVKPVSMQLVFDCGDSAARASPALAQHAPLGPVPAPSGSANGEASRRPRALGCNARRLPDGDGLGKLAFALPSLLAAHLLRRRRGRFHSTEEAGSTVALIRLPERLDSCSLRTHRSIVVLHSAAPTLA